jgi:hypothetical protein
MPTISKPSTPTPPAETVETRFRRLAAAWERATAHLSSMKAASEHPAYQEIIQLGPEVVPLLLRDLDETERHWFVALRALTGANPIPASAAGNIPKMIEAWRTWGKENGY